MMTFAPHAALVPMSLTQQGMYFDTHVCAPSDYHVALHLRIHPVEPLLIAQAVAQVMAEQPALRSEVWETREGLSFAVMEHVDAPLEHHDLTGCGTAPSTNSRQSVQQMRGTAS